jgi:hypothetical protein
MYTFEVSAVEATHWWRENEPVGALLNKLMILFIFVPIGLVLYEFYALSFIVFAFMVPYGFLVRYLAVRAVRQYLKNHPEQFEEFRDQGIVSL